MALTIPINKSKIFEFVIPEPLEKYCGKGQKIPLGREKMAKRDIRKAQRAKDKASRQKKEEKDLRNQSILAQDTIKEIISRNGETTTTHYSAKGSRFLSF